MIRAYWHMPAGWKILLWLGLGLIIGMLLGESALVLQPAGDLFLRLLLMAAVPLVFFNLLAGITANSDARKVGVLGAKVFVYYTVSTIFALVVGLCLAHLIRPGESATLRGEVEESLGSVPDIGDVLLGMIPANVFQAMAEGQLAQLVVFAAMLGCATLLLPGQQREPIARFFGLGAAVLRKLVELILVIAPYGVGALAAATAGRYGAELFGALGLFVLTIWLGHGVMVVLYMFVLAIWARYSPRAFLAKTAPLYATTVATCSSLASLVVSMDLAGKKLKLDESVYSFTLPLGAQINKDGTAIMLAVILLFTAQAAGIEFTLSQQITILITGLLISEGSGGIPGGGLVVALTFVKAFNLPIEIAGVVAGVYRLIDMGSTTVNCMGDLVCATVFGRRRSESLPS
ncbi:MAG: dicarboxylate/amino acid:cation symporter [Planctomycetota bacterium]